MSDLAAPDACPHCRREIVRQLRAAADSMEKRWVGGLREDLKPVIFGYRDLANRWEMGHDLADFANQIGK